MTEKEMIIRNAKKAIDQHLGPLTKQLSTGIVEVDEELENQISREIARMQAMRADVVAALDVSIPDDPA